MRLMPSFLSKEIKPRGLVFINLAGIHLALCMYAASELSFMSLVYYAFAATG